MKSIPASKTLVLGRSIVFSRDLCHRAGYAPVCDNKGASFRIGTGCKVCVAHFPLSDGPHRSALMTTVYGGKPVYGWVDADDLMTPEEAEAEGIPAYLP